MRIGAVGISAKVLILGTLIVFCQPSYGIPAFARKYGYPAQRVTRLGPS